jgi:23S rRNA (uracil1939-C5)-methyltransferase
MTQNMNEPQLPIVTVTPTSLVYGGEAMGRLPDGRAVFVPYALPGETISVQLVEQKRGYARGELLEVLTPSQARIEPLCLHFGVCGGCHYQHMSYEDQLTAKTGILGEQLERIGGLVDPPVEPAVSSPNQTLYRNHVQFHLTADGKIGYHKARSDEVLPIQECHLPESPLNAIWPQLDFEALPGLERFAIRLGIEDDVQIILESSDLKPPEINIQDLPVSVVHLSPVGSLVLGGSEVVWIEVLERSFQVSAGSFFQVNTPMAAGMVAHLLEILPNYQPPKSDATLLDVYCGVGLFSAFLAPLVSRLVGIESSPTAASDFVANLDEFDHVELYEATAEEVLPNLEIAPDIVLLDPPRAGISRQAMDGLLGLASPLLVYISCDPATLARDAKRLTARGYRLEQITPFDLFPQTYHIESISFWTIGVKVN